MGILRNFTSLLGTQVAASPIASPLLSLPPLVQRGFPGFDTKPPPGKGKGVAVEKPYDRVRPNFDRLINEGSYPGPHAQHFKCLHAAYELSPARKGYFSTIDPAQALCKENLGDMIPKAARCADRAGDMFWGKQKDKMMKQMFQSISSFCKEADVPFDWRFKDFQEASVAKGTGLELFYKGHPNLAPPLSDGSAGYRGVDNMVDQSKRSHVLDSSIDKAFGLHPNRAKGVDYITHKAIMEAFEQSPCATVRDFKLALDCLGNNEGSTLLEMARTVAGYHTIADALRPPKPYLQEAYKGLKTILGGNQPHFFTEDQFVEAGEAFADFEGVGKLLSDQQFYNKYPNTFTSTKWSEAGHEVTSNLLGSANLGHAIPPTPRVAHRPILPKHPDFFYDELNPKDSLANYPAEKLADRLVDKARVQPVRPDTIMPNPEGRIGKAGSPKDVPKQPQSWKNALTQDEPPSHPKPLDFENVPARWKEFAEQVADAYRKGQDAQDLPKNKHPDGTKSDIQYEDLSLLRDAEPGSDEWDTESEEGLEDLTKPDGHPPPKPKLTRPGGGKPFIFDYKGTKVLIDAEGKVVGEATDEAIKKLLGKKPNHPQGGDPPGGSDPKGKGKQPVQGVPPGVGPPGVGPPGGPPPGVGPPGGPPGSPPGVGPPGVDLPGGNLPAGGLPGGINPFSITPPKLSLSRWMGYLSEMPQRKWARVGLSLFGILGLFAGIGCGVGFGLDNDDDDDEEEESSEGESEDNSNDEQNSSEGESDDEQDSSDGESGDEQDSSEGESSDEKDPSKGESGTKDRPRIKKPTGKDAPSIPPEERKEIVDSVKAMMQDPEKLMARLEEMEPGNFNFTPQMERHIINLAAGVEDPGAIFKGAAGVVMNDIWGSPDMLRLATSEWAIRQHSNGYEFGVGEEIWKAIGELADLVAERNTHDDAIYRYIVASTAIRTINVEATYDEKTHMVFETIEDTVVDVANRLGLQNRTNLWDDVDPQFYSTYLNVESDIEKRRDETPVRNKMGEIIALYLHGPVMAS